MSNIIRKLSLFFIPLLLLDLASCGLVVINRDKFGTDKTETVSNSPDDSLTPETEPPVSLNVIENDHSDKVEKNLTLVPDEEYNDTVFKISSPNTSALDSDGGLEFLSEAADRRNRRVSAKHSISIVTSKVDPDVFYEDVNTAVKSGMYYSDLLMVPQSSVASFAAGNLILNLRSMPGLNFEAEFFNESSVGAAAGGFASYAIAGHASMYPFSLPAVFFNKDLCNAGGFDLYSLTKSGMWTWDKFFEVCTLAYDNEYKFSWGTTDLDEAVYDAAFVSSGSKMITSGLMQIPSLAFDSYTAAYSTDVIKKLYAEEDTIRVNSNSMAYFKEGNGVFLIEHLSSMTELRNAGVNWGLLPMPKADTAESYTSLSGSASLMFACPSTVSTPEKTANILMSMNAASDGNIKDAYINYIQYNFLRDNESANMLDYIIDGAVYDFSYTFGNMYGGIADGTYNMVRKAATTDESIDSLIGKYKGTLDRTLAQRFGLSN